MEGRTAVLLITANVGSIFEDPDTMITLWVQEFFQTIANTDAKLIALHCQEVGGKNYELRMQHVDNFVKRLVSSDEMKSYDKAEIFIDEDFSCAENFTALGNFYFVHETVTDVQIWDFDDAKFVALAGKGVHSGNIENVPIKEKSKFPQHFFPECKWSRKGFLRTRWSLNGTIFDLVNIHLFHDASNFVAMQAFPSVYTVTRQKALQYTLDRLYDYEEGSAPFFLFGDFNFRTDTKGVIKKLANGLNECKENDSASDETLLQYKDETSEVVMSIGKKEFIHSDHQNVFIQDSDWLKEFDREMEPFKDQLYEFPINFLPSYPFEENCELANSYMKTRCPAWCDRVLLSITAKKLIYDVDNSEKIKYGVIGKESCMGDHKPVYLRLEIIDGSGMVATSTLKNACSACRLSSNSSSSSSSVADALSFKTYLTVDKKPPRWAGQMSPVTEYSANDELEFIDDSRASRHAEEMRKYYEMSTASPTSRSLDEGTSIINQRSRSASAADTSWKGCSCSPHDTWVYRSASITSRTSSWHGRMRLKSDPNLKTSLPRIQSHHSSSDEEWFEEEETETVEAVAPAVVEVVESETEDAPSLPLTNDDRRRGYFLCCIPKMWRRDSKRRRESNISKRNYFKLPSKRRCILINPVEDVWQKSSNSNCGKKPVHEERDRDRNVMMKETTV